MRDLYTHINEALHLSEGLIGARGSRAEQMEEVTKGLLADSVLGWVNRSIINTRNQWRAESIEVSGKDVIVKVDMTEKKGHILFLKITDTEGLMDAYSAGYSVKLIPAFPTRDLPFLGLRIEAPLSRQESKAVSDALGSLPFTAVNLERRAKADGLDLTVSCGSANERDEDIEIWIRCPVNALKNVNFHMDRSSSDPNTFTLIFDQDRSGALDASEVGFDGWDWLSERRILTEVNVMCSNMGKIVHDMLDNSYDRIYIGDYFKQDIDKVRMWLDETVLPGGILLKDTLNYDRLKFTFHDNSGDVMEVFPQKMWREGREPEVEDNEFYISSKKYKGIIYRVTYA